jgi:hypothetical protein
LKLEHYRYIIIAVSLVLIVVIVSSAFTELFSFQSGTESFSDFWLLNHYQVAEGYPFNLTVGEDYSFSVGVENNVGFLTYYKIVCKLRNPNQPSPDISNSEPSEVPPLQEYYFFIENKGQWINEVKFKILNAHSDVNSMLIENVAFDNVVYSINNLSLRTNNTGAFNYQLLFELWIYDESQSDFRYENVVWLWFNVNSN